MNNVKQVKKSFREASIDVEKFNSIKTSLNIVDERARYAVAGYILHDIEDMDIGV